MPETDEQTTALLIKRDLYGHNTAIRHRCSNGVEQIQVRKRIDAAIDITTREIAELELSALLGGT